MSEKEILDLYRNKDYGTLEELGYFTPDDARWAYEYGAISEEEAEKLAEWFF